MKILYTIIIALCFMACSEPIPEEKKDYIGFWRSHQSDLKMSINITEDGRAAYFRADSNRQTKVDANIGNWSDDGFSISFLFINSDFKINKKPYVE
jgi:outer membrane biogenesis lipoprotein LolB